MQNPTPEQYEILNAFQKGQNLRIHAYAGTGKTSTLSWLARHTKGRGLYLAFNRSVMEDATGRFPVSFGVSTFHGLANRWARRDFSENKRNYKPLPRALQKAGFVPDIFGLTNHSAAHLIQKTIDRFCQSRDRELSEHHIPWKDKTFTADKRVDLKSYKRDIVQAAGEAWNVMKEKDESLGLGHDGYLKLFALENEALEYDVIFVDEAQDLNPVMLQIVDQFEGQKILAGDGYQQIYAWRGAMNAMRHRFESQDCYLTKTFRFGAQLAAVSNEVLRPLGAERKLVPNHTANTTVETTLSHPNEVNTFLYRRKASMIQTVLRWHKIGQPFHLVPKRNLDELITDYDRLNKGKWAQSQTFQGFKRWSDVVKISREQQGSAFRGIVRLFEDNDLDTIKAAINASQEEESHRYPNIMTIHQAKGREWATVYLADDFPIRFINGKLTAEDREDVRLLYVGLTRAKERLILPKRLLDGIMSQAHPSPPKVLSSPPLSQTSAAMKMKTSSQQAAPTPSTRPVKAGFIVRLLRSFF